MVLRHIVKNAQDATPASGDVVVCTHQEEDTVTITVRDSGTGMEMSFVNNQLFQPFFTTKGSGGMGIGAYQAKEFARSAGGAVEVKSEPGVGTTFTMRLPIFER